VRAGFDDPAVVHHQDPVGGRRLAQPMRHHQSGPVAEHRCGGRVQAAGSGGPGLGRGLVEDHHVRVGQLDAGQRDHLALHGVERMSALADEGVDAVGQVVDPVRADGLQRGAHLGEAGLGPGRADVLGHGGGEGMDLLRDHRDVPPQLDRVHVG